MMNKINITTFVFLFVSTVTFSQTNSAQSKNQVDTVFVSSEDLLLTYKVVKNFAKEYGFTLPKAAKDDSIKGAAGLMKKTVLVKSNSGAWSYATYDMFLTEMWLYTARGTIEEFTESNKSEEFKEGNLEVLRVANAGLNSSLSNDFKMFLNIPKAFAKYNLEDFKGALKDINSFIQYAEINYQKKIKSPTYDYTSYACYIWRAYYLRIVILNSMSGNENYIKLIEDCNTLIKVKSETEKKNKIPSENIERNEFYFYLRGVAKVNLGKRSEGCEDFRKAVNLGSKQALEVLKGLKCN